ncbi:signal peptidase I [Natronospora cellulosivora (SeqCode)]
MIDSGDIKEFIQSLIIAGILAFFIITFVAQSFVVDGQSMAPSLHNGERLFVNKFIYRFREPERYEVIVFTPEGAPRNRFIKRVIALPGETIYIRDGVTYIDGEPLREPYLKEEMHGDFGPSLVPEKKLFVMGDNRNHSADSRIPTYVGFVDYKSISGKAFWVYWPLREMRVIDNKILYGTR